MTSVGIDVSKGKSTVCILKPYGEVVAPPYEILHTEPEISALVSRIQSIIAFAGIDSPPFQSGSFTGTRRKICK